MASIYKPKDKTRWYISFIDPVTDKPRNISTKLKATKENLKKAKEFKKKIEEFVENKKKEYEKLPFRKKTIDEAFLHFKNNNYSKHPKTIKGYDTFYSRFKADIDVNQPVTVLSKLSSEAWLNKIKSAVKTKNTAFNYYKVFNKFLRFLFEYEYIPVFIINKDIRVHPERKPIVVFTEDDKKKILESLDTKKKFKLQDYDIFTTLYRPSSNRYN